MDLQLTTRNIHADNMNAMREYLERKMAFLPKIIGDEKIWVTILKEGRLFTVITQINLGGQLMKMHSDSDKDAYTAIDVLIYKIKQSIRNRKNEIKYTERMKRARRHNPEDGKYEFCKDSIAPGKIVKRKKFNTTPMTEEAAILEMELLGHESFIFMNSELDGKICMLYVRLSDGYGLIELN